MQREFFTTKHAKAAKNGKVWFVLIRFSSFVISFENRCCANGLIPSFPHAFSGNPGKIRTGPPIKAFGGDELGFRAQVSSSVGERKLMKHFVNSVVQEPVAFWLRSRRAESLDVA